MTSINFPRDDEGRTRLQISNRKKKPGTVQETAQVEPYPRITRARTPSHAKTPYREETPPQPVRRQQDRRKFQRRQKDSPVLLDTRSKHERRTRRRRADDSPSDHGIDRKV